jgi:hypothetical protein
MGRGLRVSYNQLDRGNFLLLFKKWELAHRLNAAE